MPIKPFSQIGEFGEALEEGIAQQAKAVVNTAKTQITGQTSTPQQSPQTPASSPQKPVSQESGTNEAISASQPQDDQAGEDFVKELYAPSDNSNETSKAQVQTQTAAVKKSEGNPKTPEEMQKIKSLTDQLHAQTYFQPTFERPKEAEEHAGEKREDEEEQKSKQLEELKEDEKKNGPPLAVQQASLAHERKFGSG